MELGMIGLGRMGGNMVKRLLRGGHDCVAYDRDPNVTADFDKAEPRRARKASSVADLVNQLAAPRAVWLMLPAGDITDNAVNDLATHLRPGDTVLDGGNAHFPDDIRRAKVLRTQGLHYCDVGTSGGVWGLERGYCLMVGGPKEVFDRLEPIFAALAPGGDGKTRAERGYIHAGPAGAGHFVKMVHNGIEYGMMQAFAEGFELLHRANFDKLPEERRFDLDLADVAEVWRHGSVVSSWLLDLLASALKGDPKLGEFSGRVGDSGEGRWTVQAAIDEDVPAHVLAASLFARFRSRTEESFADKALSAMRKGFGGHAEAK